MLHETGKITKHRDARRSACKWILGVVCAFGALLAVTLPALAVGSGWTSDVTAIGPSGTNGGREGATVVQVLAGTGGTGSEPCQDKYAMVVGGEVYGAFGANGTASALTQCFDPSTTTTAANTAASMNTARADFALFQVPNTTDAGSACRGKIIAAGGYTNSATPGNVTASTEQYDPTNNTWTNLSTSLGTARWGLDMGRSLVQLKDGRFMVVGGFTDTSPQTPSAKVDIFNIAQCAWNVNNSGVGFTPAPMAVTRGYPAAGVLVDGRVLVCSGYKDTHSDEDLTCEYYSPPLNTGSGTGSWTTGPSVHTGHGSPANAAWAFNDTSSCSQTNGTDYSCSERLPANASFSNGRVLIAAGANTSNFSPTSEAQECDTSSCGSVTTVSTAATYPQAVRLDAGAYSTNREILLCGGYLSGGNTTTDACQVYDPSTSHWSTDTTISPMPRARADAFMLETCGGVTSICSTGASDQVIAAGGNTSISSSGNSNELTDVDRLST